VCLCPTVDTLFLKLDRHYSFFFSAVRFTRSKVSSLSAVPLMGLKCPAPGIFFLGSQLTLLVVRCMSAEASLPASRAPSRTPFHLCRLDSGRRPFQPLLLRLPFPDLKLLPAVPLIFSRWFLKGFPFLFLKERSAPFLPFASLPTLFFSGLFGCVLFGRMWSVSTDLCRPSKDHIFLVASFPRCFRNPEFPAQSFPSSVFV